MYRKAYVEIDVDKIQNNIRNVIKKYDDYKYYIGVVKGNCYGHGPYMAKYIVESGINYLAVSSLDEAIEIREYVDTPMMCLEPIEIAYLPKAIELNLAVTVSSVDYYREMIKHKLKGLKVHMKLNTGMNRLGIDEIEEVEEIYNGLMKNKDITLEGIFTHFSTTGIQDTIFDYQLNKFRELTSTIDLKKIKMIHLGRSSTLEVHPKIDIANGIRLGIIMYGIGQTFRKYEGFKGKLRKIKHDYIVKKYKISKTYEENDLKIETGMSLKATVMEVNRLKKGQFVGYGGTYMANKDSYIAICPIGYADGLLLNYKDCKVSINNNLYNIVGSVNMGMLTIEVDSTVKVGDIATIFGENISVKKTSSIVHTIPYVIMTTVNPNLTRIYIKNGKIDKKIN